MAESDLVYRTSDGDMLDWIAWQHYGRQRGIVERIVEANPGLADYPPILPVGVLLRLPPVPPPVEKREQRIWS